MIPQIYSYNFSIDYPNFIVGGVSGAGMANGWSLLIITNDFQLKVNSYGEVAINLSASIYEFNTGSFNDISLMNDIFGYAYVNRTELNQNLLPNIIRACFCSVFNLSYEVYDMTEKFSDLYDFIMMRKTLNVN